MGDPPSKRGETLRPPSPGTTEEVVVPRIRSRRPPTPRPVPLAPPREQEPRGTEPSPPPESWRPPPHQSWPALPAVEERVSEFPDLFVAEDTDPAISLLAELEQLEAHFTEPVSAPTSTLTSTPDASTSRPSRRDPRRADPEGGQPVRMERAVAAIDARDTAIPEPLPPDRQQRVAQLVRELAKSGPESDGPIRKRLLAMGPECLPALCRAFPGNLWIDLNRPHRPVRSARLLSGLSGALAAFGDPAVPYVATLLRAPRAEVRLAACVVAADLIHGDLVRPLAARLQDELGVVRNAAMLALRACALLPEARALRHELVAMIQDESKKKDWRKKAAWTIGQLRDPEAVPHLIEALSDSAVHDTARQALVTIIGRDHGRFVFRWRSWWRSHGEEGRGAWLIDALDQKDAALRARVAEELVLLTGEGFDLRNATTTREQAVELGARYAQWLRDSEK